MKRKQSFFAGSIVLLASAVITKIIGALFKIPLTNILGGTGMGYFGCAYGLFLPIYAVCSTGLTTAASRLTAESAALNRYADVRKIRRTALLCFSLCGAVCGMLLALLAKPFSDYAAHCPQAFPAVLMLAPSVLFGCILAVYRGCCEGLENMYPTALSQVVEALVKLICGLLLCRLAIENFDALNQSFPTLTREAAGAAGAVLGVTLSSGVGAVFLMLGGKLPAEENQAGETMSSRLIIKRLVLLMIPVALGSLVTNLTSVIDLVTIIRGLTRSIEKNPEYFTEQFGFSPAQSAADSAGFIFGSFTGLAITIFNLVPSITNMLGKSVLPAVTAAKTEGNQEKILHTVRSAISLTSFIAVPCAAGICILSQEILVFLFPRRLSEIAVCSNSLAVLGIAVLFLSLSFPLFSVLQGAGRADLPVKLMIAGAAVKLIGNLLLLPYAQLGVTGAAISTLLCYFLIFILCTISIKRVTGIRMQAVKWMLPFCINGILCAAAAYLCRNLSGSLILSIACGGIVYFLGLTLSGGMKTLKNRMRV